MFGLEPRTVGWIIVACIGLAVFLYAAWHFETIWKSIFGGSDESEVLDPLRTRYSSFMIGQFEHRCAEVYLLRNGVTIRFEQDMVNLAAPDAEMGDLICLVKLVFGSSSPTAGSFLARINAAGVEAKGFVSKIESLQREVLASKKRADDYYISFQKHEGVKKLLAEAIAEREVADKLLQEKTNWIANAKSEMAKVVEALTEAEQMLTNQAHRLAASKRFGNHLKEAYRQVRQSKECVEGELAKQRTENNDLRDEFLAKADLIEQMGQRILRQAELLAKKAEKANPL